jgi:hypothetical protein
MPCLQFPESHQGADGAPHRPLQGNADYVGEQFAEEARKIHYGETDKRNIYGEASKEEAKELVEEGIDVAVIPWLPRGDA